MMGLMGGTTVVAVCVMLAPSDVLAQVPANARLEISAAEAGSSLTREAFEKQIRDGAASEIRVFRQRITILETQLAEARGSAGIAALEAELIAAREGLVADLAQDDPAYAEAIAFFRREVTQIASTPEGAAALAQFNLGEYEEAFAILDRLIAAEDQARQLALENATRAMQLQGAREAAASRRSVAVLWLEARNRSQRSTEAVIARYEEVVRLDPGEYMDWFQLVQLYIAAGRRADALAAAERLEALADNEGTGPGRCRGISAALRSMSGCPRPIRLLRTSRGM